MVRKCILCGNKDRPFYQIPSNPEFRKIWFDRLQCFCDISKIKDYSVLCRNHFENNCFLPKKRSLLKKDAIPSIFSSEFNNIVPDEDRSLEINSKSIQVDLQLPAEYENWEYRCRTLIRTAKDENRKYLECQAKLTALEDKLKNYSEIINKIDKLTKDAEECDGKAVFILDLVKNYGKASPRWSELTVRMCTAWRFCSPKGYRFCHQHLMNIPSKTTMVRYLGSNNGPNELIRQRLLAEVANFKAPVERVCSLIVDDMAIREKMHYSRSEDYIHGLNTCNSDTVGQNVSLANKMCFVVHGLSTQYTIPAGYYFHSILSTEELYSLAMNVLNILTDCGFIVLRFVSDNAPSNVALFKKFGNGLLQNRIYHPILQNLPLFLSFDFCHALKNARNLFLDHNMCSSKGIISSDYIKILYHLQQGLPIKPVRYLTKKHLYPSNFEKMNVLRAIQVFSPLVTTALKYLKENGDQRFSNVCATVQYMENMYQFFQLHNVSSRYHYIKSLDSSIAPYVHISDDRLHWLNMTFPNYIDEVQNVSAEMKIKGLSSETAHALKFTAQSTYLCVNFLLQEVGFYYVLTRSFSSDAIEATFSHVRLHGGSQDATDARAAEYALRQILRCGLILPTKSSNCFNKVNFTSNTQITASTGRMNNTEDLLLPVELRLKIQSLQLDITPENTIYFASSAFLAGYIIKQIDEKFQCGICTSLLLGVADEGPLPKLIRLQNRGHLMYPTTKFIGLISKIGTITQEILPYLQQSNICKQMVKIMQPVIAKNSLLSCSDHKDAVSTEIIQAAVKPVVSNICLETTNEIKRSLPNKNKPLSRKILKI